MRFAAGLPNSDADSSNLNDNRPKKTRISYLREKKLQAITYFEMTDVLGTKGRANTPISLARAARTLGIDRKQLRDWWRNKTKILHMKKGAKRWRGVTSRREPELEFRLHAAFTEARAKGRIIASRWFLQNAKQIYRDIYLRRISQDEVTGHFEYNLFRFFNGWFQGFRRRYNIALRCKTKQAQICLKDFRLKIEQWLKYNRRNTVININSDCGIPRLLSILLVGRFKLLEIGNIDQTPITFEFLSGRTYDYKGAKSV
jgi:hypothetical protein